ncbi:MAG: HAD hydrolase family protein, partial [Oscillospiraceae bacterium]
ISFVVSDIDKTPDNWNKISICGEEKDISEIAQYIQGRKRTAEVFQAVDVISTGKNVCELIPEGVDKGEGLLRLCEIVNVTKDNVVAIGNDFEDMPMFLNAGISVAVGDAPPEVRKSVEIVVKSCLHGGVAQILRSLESMLDGFEQIRLEM